MSPSRHSCQKRLQGLPQIFDQMYSFYVLHCRVSFRNFLICCPSAEALSLFGPIGSAATCEWVCPHSASSHQSSWLVNKSMQMLISSTFGRNNPGPGHNAVVCSASQQYHAVLFRPEDRRVFLNLWDCCKQGGQKKLYLKELLYNISSWLQCSWYSCHVLIFCPPFVLNLLLLFLCLSSVIRSRHTLTLALLPCVSLCFLPLHLLAILSLFKLLPRLVRRSLICSGLVVISDLTPGSLFLLPFILINLNLPILFIYHCLYQFLQLFQKWFLNALFCL